MLAGAGGWRADCCPLPCCLCRYEQYITYGGAVLQVFQMYRLIVLPVANTWMSWSLLNKLGIAPGTLVVAAAGLAVMGLIVAGVQVGAQPAVVAGRPAIRPALMCCTAVCPADYAQPRVCSYAFSLPPLLPHSHPLQMRFLLHAPLQLASVLFAASSTTEVCGRFFSTTTSLGCMGAVSLMQLSLGVFIPGIMCHLLDMRSTTGRRLARCCAEAA